MSYCDKLHELFNGMHRFNAYTIDEIEFNNGIYIFFGENERYGNLDRIIRVGTDTGENQLKSRLRQHLLNENKDRSIFRKNIGRAMLNNASDAELLRYWNLDLTTSENRNKYYNSHLDARQRQLEIRISAYLGNMTFVVFEVNTKEERLRLEEAIISTLYHEQRFTASENWLGNYMPQIRNNHVRDSRMWVSQGIYANPLTEEEYEKIVNYCMREI